VACWAAVAHAQLRYRVVLLKPPVTDDVTADALARVRGELTAAGFDVSHLPQDPALDVRTALETVGRELDPIAAFAIVRAATENTAEIWVCDRMAGKSVIQSVRLDVVAAPGEPSRSVVLAVQAVELLKASLAQYWLASERRRSTETGGAATPVAPARAVTAGLGVEAAVGVLDNAGAVSPVWQPMVRASYGGDGGWAGRLTVGGMGSDAELHAAEGTAQIRQMFGLIEILRGFRAGTYVQPIASAGAGVYRARIAGVGAPNYDGSLTDTWSALVVVGGGVVVPIVAHVALVVDAQVGLTWPDNLIRVNFTEAGRLGRPSLLASAGVLATF
ncbi:MAG TPA: hypothetical protein VN903_36620, partial [Polyangia bacterium]|nr:hypothetical protein [Polyangia bacterium]